MMRTERGVTLLDMVIAVSIVVVVLAVAYPGLKVANDTMATSGSKDRMERAGDKLLKTVIEEIRAGRVADVSATGVAPFITLSRPMRSVDLADLSPEGGTPWLTQNHTLRFRQTSVLVEYEAKEDINGDGDRNDRFAAGFLELDDGASVRPILTRAQVILGLPTYRDDVDGDGEPDPLFAVDRRSAVVEIHLISRDPQGRLAQCEARCSVHLRNPQE